MVRMINVVTMTEMYVAEDRVDEYKAMGHKVATGSLVSEMAKMAAEPIPEKENPVEATTKKLKKTISKTARKKA